MKWWSTPKQRQLWHSSQILPSDTDNWGQIFFDLFFVGGAYNLSNVLKTSDSLDPRTILYFCATGFPSMAMWYDKLYFDARFTTRPGRDVVHRTIEILQLCCVATALSRIRSVEVESHPCNHIDVFEFALALFLYSALTIGRYIEIVCFVEGDPGARVVARTDILCRIVPALFLLAAAVESGLSSWSINGDHDEQCEANEKPIWYCLASWISGLVIGYFNQILSPKVGEQKLCEKISVPINVNFCMHRYGEWFMLMFGESIMSLLIVEGDNESWNHNLKFYAGILSVTFLAQLHFKSEPGHDEDHALSRSRSSNYLYTAWLVPVYSMALIATGICYKMFLYNYMTKYTQDDANYDSNHRNLGGGNNAGNGYAATDDHTGGNSYYEQLEELEQHTADLFGRSLALVMICTDVNLLLHQGKQTMWDHIRAMPRSRITLWILCKVSLLLVVATVSYFQNDPHVLALLGFGAILCQHVLGRIFRAWQQENKISATNIDDIDETSYHSGCTDRKMLAYPEDKDYWYQIQRLKIADAALAKFEQEAVNDAVEGSNSTLFSMIEVDNKPPEQQPQINIMSTDSYHQLS